MQRVASARFMTISMLSACGHALAGDIRVPDDVPTIQGAIEIAVDGDRVLVGPGVYGPIDFLGKAIVVESVDGAGSATIDGGGAEVFVVRFDDGEGRESVLRGFTITGGLGATRGDDATGGGVLVLGSSATIDACVISGNTGLEGGGVAIIEGDALITSTRFENNLAFHGGAVGVFDGGVEIRSCDFVSNTAISYGGAASLTLADTVIVDSSFTGNTASGFGGAVYSNHSEIDARGLSVVSNGTAEEGDHGTRTFSTFGGGGIYTTGTDVRILSSRFEDNAAYAGGGVYIAGDREAEIVNCLIGTNVTALGGVYCNSSSPRLINCTIVDNLTFGVFTTYNAFPELVNCVLTGQTNVASTEIAGNGITSVRYSLIDGDAFSVDLLDGVIFASALLGDDFAPLAGSPAIDAGDNGAVPGDITTDLLGNARFADDPNTDDTGLGDAPIVDLGAIEFGAEGAACPGDHTGDGELDGDDFFVFLDLFAAGHDDADVDGDGEHDANDFFAYLDLFAEGC